MTPKERDARLAELNEERAEVLAAKAQLAELDIDAEVGTTPTPEAVDSVRRKLSAITARLDAAKGGGKLSRTETVTVRLDPKLRYLAELAARLHRRTLSSYIEWSIKASLDTETVRPTNLNSLEASDQTIGNEAEYLWDVDEADRFAKLALRYPHLLTHDEQVRWKLIRECVVLWRNGFPGDENRQLDFEKLRRNWGAVSEASAEGKTGVDLDFLVE